MSKEFAHYLDDILDAVAAIRDYTLGMGFDQFSDDRKTRDAVIRNLEVIGEAARNLPEDIKAAMPDIEWRKIVALRNILAHEYFGVDIRIIWDIVQNRVGPLENACRKKLAEQK